MLCSVIESPGNRRNTPGPASRRCGSCCGARCGGLPSGRPDCCCAKATAGNDSASIRIRRGAAKDLVVLSKECSRAEATAQPVDKTEPLSEVYQKNHDMEHI